MPANSTPQQRACDRCGLDLVTIQFDPRWRMVARIGMTPASMQVGHGVSPASKVASVTASVNARRFVGLQVRRDDT